MAASIEGTSFDMPPPTTSGARSRELRKAAADVFGHDELRPGQSEAVNALLDGHDVLLVAPTGSGKSLTYQLPAVLVEGPTLVISPLLALQRDQVERLEVAGADTRAARISSAETERQRHESFRAAAGGTVEFLFMSPEQLANREVRQQVKSLGLSLIAIDEAHCVSTWGHDFRPDYLRLGELIDELGHPPVIALTATAAAPVQNDIVDRLRFRNPRVIVQGFARPNIDLSVLRCLTAGDQARAVTEAVLATDGPGIVYCGTRRATQDYADVFADRGLRATAYHAGLAKTTRDRAHEEFTTGKLDAIVATSAFGMGIDKPDIRYVVHAQVPGSLDSYYQEIGRAGRDGGPALALLLYRPEDLALSRYRTPGVPDRSDVAAVAAALSDRPKSDWAELERCTGLSRRRVGRIANLLAEATAEDYGVDPPDSAALTDAALARAESHRRLERSRLEMMRGYAETTQCRRQFLLGYFGEELSNRCEACDTCRAGTATSTSAGDAATRPYTVNSRVHHEQFGEGTVMDLDGEKITVLFADAGYRTLQLRAVQRNRLLRSV